MAINRGKDFEKKFKTQLQTVFEVVRLQDSTCGYLGGRNICDFIAYSYPYIYFLELKSVKGNLLPFTNITDTQWIGLYNVARRQGVCAGIIVWFIDHDKTYFISIEYLNELKARGKKSLNIKDCLSHEDNCNCEYLFHLIEIEGLKNRVFMTYNIPSLKFNLERLMIHAK